MCRQPVADVPPAGLPSIAVLNGAARRGGRAASGGVHGSDSTKGRQRIGIMRLLLDTCLSGKTAEVLCASGHDVVWTGNLALPATGQAKTVRMPVFGEALVASVT